MSSPSLRCAVWSTRAAVFFAFASFIFLAVGGSRFLFRILHRAQCTVRQTGQVRHVGTEFLAVLRLYNTGARPQEQEVLIGPFESLDAALRFMLQYEREERFSCTVANGKIYLYNDGIWPLVLYSLGFTLFFVSILYIIVMCARARKFDFGWRQVFCCCETRSTDDDEQNDYLHL